MLLPQNGWGSADEARVLLPAGTAVCSSIMMIGIERRSPAHVDVNVQASPIRVGALLGAADELMHEAVERAQAGFLPITYEAGRRDDPGRARRAAARTRAQRRQLRREDTHALRAAEGRGAPLLDAAGRGSRAQVLSGIASPRSMSHAASSPHGRQGGGQRATASEMARSRPVDRLRPVRPGEVLREALLVPLGLGVNARAVALDVAATRIHEIVKERRGITADRAARLSRPLGGDAASWLVLQANCDFETLAPRKGIERKVQARESLAA